MPNPPKQRSTEHYGVGQSGFTSGRVEGDRALERQVHDRNVGYPKDGDDKVEDRGDDERFTGRGGRRWVPEEADPETPPEK